MKQLHGALLRRLPGVWAVLALGGVLGLAAAAGTETGFTSLFNGKDLTGWRYPGQKGAPMGGKTKTPDGRVAAQEGVIVMNEKDAGGKGGIRDLYTQKSFDTDFVLRLQFRAGLKADSGVYLRGPQLQVRDFLRRGEQKQLTKYRNDDWNDLEVVVKGTEATFTVNGEVLKPERMVIPAQGPIGLQAETGKFEFRNVRIKAVP
jgi:hypothetical protein